MYMDWEKWRIIETVRHPRGYRTVEAPGLLTSLLQAGDDQWEGVVPEGAIRTIGQVVSGWPVGPVRLVVRDAVQPLDNWNVNLLAPVDFHCLRGQFGELGIAGIQRSHLVDNLVVGFVLVA